MNIKEQVQEIFRDIFDDEELVIYDEMTAMDYDDWDSLAQLQIIAATEKKFNIKFTINDITSFRSVGDFIKSITAKIN